MPRKQAIARKKVARTYYSKSPDRKENSRTNKSTQLRNIFSFPKGERIKGKNEFSTSLEYGTLALDIKSRNQGNLVKVDIKIVSKEFNFIGTATLSERSYSAFEKTFNNLISNIRRIGR